MVEKHRDLVNIPCTREKLMPLYGAALFGNYQVVKYLYEYSKELREEDGWNDKKRGWLLERCVEGDMFDIALKIVQIYPELGSGTHVLGILAKKPHAFSEKKANIIKNRIVNPVLASICLKEETSKMKNEAWQLLECILEDIVQNSRERFLEILKGPSDKNDGQDEKIISEKAVQALKLKKLILERVDRLSIQAKKIERWEIESFDKDMEEDVKTRYQGLRLEELIIEHIVNMHDATKNLIKGIDSKSDEVLTLQNLIAEHNANLHVKMKKILKKESSYESQMRLLYALIFGSLASIFEKLNALSDEVYSPRVLFIAAEMGNTIFIVELIRRYPDLMWKINDNRQSIFHIAVKHRYEGVYSLLYELGSMKDMITPNKDEDGNNMLHLAGKMPASARLSDVSGAALKMQKELLWFQEVKNMIPPSYRERKNKDGLTPHEVFTEEHKELMGEAEAWMKATASQCMVVAALIATIVFAAAFTIPGGYNQNNGIPIFYWKPIFIVFVVADALSLFLSTASILIFLSLLTSRYAERDFVKSLPNKLTLGVVTLFLSIATMMVTFSVSFFILYHNGMKWIPILISICAISPVLLYVLLQLHLLIDVIRSAYGSKHLFKRDKRVLYYVNPRV